MSSLKGYFLLFILVSLLLFYHCLHEDHAIEHFEERNKLFAEEIPSEVIMRQFDDSHGVSNVKQFAGEVLGYVTPWNTKGSDYAIKFASKFDFLSPVWFEIRFKDYNNINAESSGNKKNHPTSENVADNVSFNVVGELNVNQQWISEVKKSHLLGKNMTNDDTLGVKTAQNYLIRIVPRFSLSDLTSKALQHFFTPGSSHPQLLAEKMVEVCKRQKFDGLVLEWGYLTVNQVFNNADLFLRLLSNKLHALDMVLILVIPAPRHNMVPFTSQNLHQFSRYVDRFSLMTYDYSLDATNVSPNAPMEWISAVIMNLLGKHKEHSKKLLVGLNFYGYMYRGVNGDGVSKGRNAILSQDFLRFLKQCNIKELKWDEIAKEHYFKVTGCLEPKETIQVFYPTPKSVQERLTFFMKTGAGASIWEIGQGPISFFDLL